jgi:hypothetical protein
MSAQLDLSLRVDGSTGQPFETGNETGTLLLLLNNSSQNSNSVETLDTGFSDPPNQDDLEALRLKLNELIRALRR